MCSKLPIQAKVYNVHTKMEVDFQFSTRILEVQFQNSRVDDIIVLQTDL